MSENCGFFVKMYIFLVISSNFTYFHGMCAPAPRPPENLARTMLFQWFWGVVFGPNPKSWSLLVISAHFLTFHENNGKAEKTRKCSFSLFGRKVTPAGGGENHCLQLCFSCFPDFGGIFLPKSAF